MHFANNREKKMWQIAFPFSITKLRTVFTEIGAFSYTTNREYLINILAHHAEFDGRIDEAVVAFILMKCQHAFLFCLQISNDLQYSLSLSIYISVYFFSSVSINLFQFSETLKMEIIHWLATEREWCYVISVQIPISFYWHTIDFNL